MKKIILNTEGECSLYLVPNEVSDNLKKYCNDFLYWLERQSCNHDLSYTADDFIEYLNDSIFTFEKSYLIENLGFMEKQIDLPEKYKKLNWFYF